MHSPAISAMLSCAVCTQLFQLHLLFRLFMKGHTNPYVGFHCKSFEFLMIMHL